MTDNTLKKLEKWLMSAREFLAEPEEEAEIAELIAALRQATAGNGEALAKARCDGHGDGQMHAIADVNAGLIDDLIAPRLERCRQEATAGNDRLRALALRLQEKEHKRALSQVWQPGDHQYHGGEWPGKTSTRFEDCINVDCAFVRQGTSAASPQPCATGHEWSNPFSEDWQPDNGTPCDCRQRVWSPRGVLLNSDAAASPQPEYTEDEIAALRADFEAFVRQRGVSPDVFALACPWAASPQPQEPK